MTSVPCAAPASASSRARSLVEPDRAWCTRGARASRQLQSHSSPARTPSSAAASPPLTASASVARRVLVETSAPGATSANVRATTAASRPSTSHRSPSRSRRERPGRPVEHDVAEAVDRHDVPTTRPRAAAAGRSSRRARPGRAASPASASGSPCARCAATGPKRSRPWNVAETGSSRHGEREISTASIDAAEALRGGEQQPVVRGRRGGGPRRRCAARPRAAAADARVDHGQVHAGRREGQRPGERRAPVRHVLRRHAVPEVDDRASGRDRARSRRGRRRRTRRRPVVGEERDDHMPASASSAAISPSGVCGSASRSGSRPSSRRTSLVAGPIEATRGPSNGRPPRRRTARRSRGEQQVVGAAAASRGVVRAARRPSRRARARRPRAPRARSASVSTSRPSRARAISRALDRHARERLDQRPRRRRARARRRRRCRARAARERCPGRSRRRVHAGQVARVARCVEEPSAPFGEVTHEQVVVAQRRQRDARAARCGSPAPRHRRRRARAAARPARVACARARVTATVRAEQRPPLEPGELVAQRGDRPDERDRRRADAAAARLGHVGERRDDGALAGQRPALHDRDGLVGRPAARDQPRGDPRQRAARPCRRRACPGSARAPPSRARPLAVLVAGDERDAGWRCSRWVTGMPA